MENKNTGLIVIIIILILMLGGLTAYVIYDKTSQKNNNINNNSNTDSNTIEDSDIYGTYYTDITNKVGLTLNNDNTATYEDSCSFDGEMTGGTFKRIGNKITYTKQYDNYGRTNNGPYKGNEPTVITFTIIDKDNIRQDTDSCGQGAILKRVQ